MRFNDSILLLFVLLPCAGCELAQNYTDPEGPRYAGEHADDPAAASRLPIVKLVTFNIQFAREPDIAAQDLASRPDLAGADVILLQEMDAPGTDSIAAALRQNYVYYPGSVQKGRDFGNAVLSRWPIIDDQKIILPHKNPTDGRIRIAVRATVHTPLGDVEAYSVHTETPWLGPRARLEQAEAMLHDARERAEPTVMAGDFNTGDPGALDELVELYASDGFVWANRGSGPTSGSFTLDNTFVRRFDALGSGTVESKASDHRPGWVTIAFPQAH